MCPGRRRSGTPTAHLLAYPIECTRQPLRLLGLDVLAVGVGHAGTGVGTICTGSGALLTLAPHGYGGPTVSQKSGGVRPS